MNKQVYFTIKGLKQTKYQTLEMAEAICDAQYDNSFIIEKHTIDEIPYNSKPKENNKNNIQKLLDNLREKLCDKNINFFYKRINFDFLIEGFFEYGFKIGKLQRYNYCGSRTNDEYKICSELIQNYILNLFENYPINKIKIKKLKTDFKPCNAIQICFEKVTKYLKSEFCDENMFPYNFYIHLRGDDENNISIAIVKFDGNHGRNVNDIGTEYVDLSNDNVQKYIQNVLISI